LQQKHVDRKRERIAAVQTICAEYRCQTPMEVAEILQSEPFSYTALGISHCSEFRHNVAKAEDIVTVDVEAGSLCHELNSPSFRPSRLRWTYSPAIN
jgi:hypothetical protein